MGWESLFKVHTQKHDLKVKLYASENMRNREKRKKKYFNIRSSPICSSLPLRGHGIFRSKAICSYAVGPAPAAAAESNKWSGLPLHILRWAFSKKPKSALVPRGDQMQPDSCTQKVPKTEDRKGEGTFAHKHAKLPPPTSTANSNAFQIMEA